MGLNKFLIAFFGIVLLFGCGNPNVSTNQKGDPENTEPNWYRDLEQGMSKVGPSFIPDTTIAQISLLNSERVDLFLGELVMEQLVDEGLPKISVMSGDNSQMLTVYFHPGSKIKEFSEFEVEALKNKELVKLSVEESEFITESGIKLGLTTEELKAIKGEPMEILEAEVTIFKYQIDNYENSPFLKRYKMPNYYADYTFEKGVLTKFRFGFGYP